MVFYALKNNWMCKRMFFSYNCFSHPSYSKNEG